MPQELWLLQSDSDTDAKLDKIVLREDGLGLLNSEEFRNAQSDLIQSIPVAESEIVTLPANFIVPVYALPKATFAPDFFQFADMVLVSRRLREVLGLTQNVVQFVPIEIVSGNATAVAQDYQLMRVLARQPAMDVMRSKCESQWFTSPFTGETFIITQYVDQYVLLPDLVPRTELFRISESPTCLLAADALAARVLESGCTGIEFQNPEDRLSGTRIEHLRTVDGIAERRVGFLK